MVVDMVVEILNDGFARNMENLVKHRVILQSDAVADSGFSSRGERQPQRGAPIYYLAKFLPKHCMEIK